MSVLSRLIWSYPETVLGPFQAACFGHVTRNFVLSQHCLRTISGSLIWSGGQNQAMPEMVLGPKLAA